MMKYLQVVKTAPDKSADFLMRALAPEGGEITRFDLYQDQDYDRLVELIFASDVVQSWW
jgi:hypothetical protein